MPFRLICSRCQQDLLSPGQEVRNIGNDHSHIPTWYEKLYSTLHGKCAECGHELPEPSVFYQTLKVKITGVQTSKVLGASEDFSGV
jgi:hypothetical protein